MGLSGYDFVWIEGEHAALDRKDIQQHMIAAHAGGSAALVRLVNHDPALVKPIMDMGPDIICFPTINTVEDAKHVVAACEYPPKGVRGCNPQRASYYGRMNYVEYVQNAPKETLKMIVIEQQEGYKNLAQIVQVPGIDIIALGPGDLSLDMGFSGNMEQRELKEQISHAAAICRSFKKPFVGFPSIEKSSVKEWVDMGANMLVFAQDTTFITHTIQKLWDFYDEIVPENQRHSHRVSHLSFIKKS